MKFSLKILPIFLFVCCLQSCFTEQKANRQANKISERYPEIIAEKCGDKFPPIIVSDTTKITEYIEKIDTFLSVNTDTLIVTDTIIKDCSKSVKLLSLKLQNANRFIQVLKGDLQKNPPVVVKNVIDTAKVFSLTKQRDKALLEKEDYRTRYEVFMKVSLWCLIFIIVLISYIYVNESKPKLYKPN